MTEEFDAEANSSLANDIASSVWSDSGCNSSVTTESITEADFLDIHQDFKVIKLCIRWRKQMQELPYPRL